MRTITQTQIMAYERCKRAYFLKYVRELAWPVEKTARQEMQRGADFHLLVRQLIMGFPEASLLFPADNGKIREWVRSFCMSRPLEGYEQVFPEKEVTSLFADVMWLGKFDALAIRDDRITVYDWKTTGHRGDVSSYAASPQTRLYRFLAMTCAPRLLGSGLHGIPAENIEMVYWFPEHPEDAVRLPYSEQAYQEDMTWLHMKAREMCSDNEADYPCTEKVRGCRFCDYEAYCYPRQGGADDLLPGTGEGEIPPDDVFQTDLFSWEPSPDSEQSQTSF